MKSMSDFTHFKICSCSKVNSSSTFAFKHSARFQETNEICWEKLRTKLCKNVDLDR